MKMNKRSLAELRKLRKREQVLVEAMAEVKAVDEGESDQLIKDIVQGCITELAEIDEKENFLREMEIPEVDADADEILKKIRERNNRIVGAHLVVN